MPVTTSAVGVRAHGPVLEITTRDCLAYAAGIGDTSDAAFDDAREGFAALPQMCVSIEWPAFIDATVTRAWGMTDDEALRGVHLTQDSIFHRQVRPGDRVSTEARIVAVEPARSGARTGLTLLTTGGHGEPVTESHLTCLFRCVGVDGSPRRISDPPGWPEPAGERVDLDPVAIPIPVQMPHVYTECARIWSPIHTERAVARAAGLVEPILHGTATWALAGREIIRLAADGDPGRLARLSGRFSAMVSPGTDITVHLATRPAVGGGDLVEFEVRNPDGRAAISDGRALIRQEARTDG